MHNQRKQLKDLGFEQIPLSSNYPPRGELYFAQTTEGEFFYWLVEGEKFTLNIHNFQLSEDSVFDFSYNQQFGSQLSISCILEASGDLLLPKLGLESGHTLAYFLQNQRFRGILHKNSHFLSVGFEYKDGYLDQSFCPKFGLSFADFKSACHMLNKYPDRFSLTDLAYKLLNYREDSPAASVFYENLAQEVLSSILTTYYSQRHRLLPTDDEEALLMVTQTLDEHYMMSHSLDFLAHIAMMSKSKLKERFKQQYGMTITEYTQRRRMNVARHLLLTTDLSLGNIAKAVGYTSHSRFSTLFKRYTHKSPQDFAREVKTKKKDRAKNSPIVKR